jgi:uncharacterized membrane protein (Fun14 family)
MNDAAPGAGAGQKRRAGWPLQKLPLEVVPPISTLAALAALAAMILNQLVLPGLGSGARTEHFPKLAAVARFSANLAVTAGLITLISCVSWALLGTPRLALRRQMSVFVSAGVLAHIALSAMLYDPLAASRTQIYFAVAATNLIGMAAGSAAVSGTRGALLRIVAYTLTALAALNLATIVLEVVPDVQLDPWTHRALTVCKTAGELTYLFLLLTSAPLLIPRGVAARALLSRSVGFAVLVLTLYAQLKAHRALQNDYSLLVYSAQRVSLWLDHWVLVYSLPFCLLLSATTTGLLSGGALRTQAACGLLLIFAAGHATRAPWRLLSLAVGFMILARALIALTEHAPFRSMVPPPARNTRRPTVPAARP